MFFWNISTYVIFNICIDKIRIYFQDIFFAWVIYGLTVLRVSYGPLNTFLCDIAGFLNLFALMYIAMTMAMYTFTRFMLVCVWKRMRQMDDNLIVRIATIQAIVMSIVFTVITWIQLHGQPFGNQVSFFYF